MDSLNKFLLDVVGEKTKVASVSLPVPELSFFEKRAFGIAMNDMCRDESWLAQFEGTPLAPQAIALAEQELAQEQQQFQRRMQRVAQQQNENWEQDCIERDGIRLQKQQLLLELYKMKAMTPTPKPGDAEIGAPQMGAEALNPAASGGAAPGAAGGAPVEEATAPKLARVMGNEIDKSDPFKSHKNKGLQDALMASLTTKDRGAVPLAGALPFGSLYTGMSRGMEAGTPIEGAARGFAGGLGGTILGSMGGPLAPVTIPLGKAIGTHLTTRGMLPKKTKEEGEQPKTAMQAKVASFAKALLKKAQ